ncbi:hypothetical protein HDV06_002741 [Boothiomyces sp. JEL0866]|nr:hypothetical protein HDV06_002741 [Boothiomyces sp. JEL0866]
MDNKDLPPTYEAVVENIVDVNELDKKPLPAPPTSDIGSSSSTSTKGKENGASFNIFGMFTAGNLTEYSDTFFSSGIVESFKIKIEPYADVQVFFEEIKAIQIEYKVQSKSVVKHSCEMRGTKFVAEISTARSKIINWFSSKPGQVIIRIPTFFKLDVDMDACGEVVWNGGPSLLQDVDIKSVAGRIKIDNMYATTVDLHSSAGGITYDNSTCSKLSLKSSGGPIKSFNVTIDSAKIKSSAGAIECMEYKATNDVDIKCSAGSVKAHIDFVQNAKGEVDIHSSAGSVQAIVSQYKDLNIKSSAGSVKAELIPGETSKTKLSSSAGSVSANIRNFKGKYDCKSSAGTSTVRVNGMSLGQNNQVPPGPGKIDAHSSAGNVTLNFEY